jgi:hypothetical protein
MHHPGLENINAANPPASHTKDYVHFRSPVIHSAFRLQDGKNHSTLQQDMRTTNMVPPTGVYWTK